MDGTTTRPTSLKRILDASPNGILVYQVVRARADGPATDLRLEHINAQAERLLRLPAATCVGRLASEIFSATPGAGQLAQYLHAAETGASFYFETDIYVADNPQPRSFVVRVCADDDNVVATYQDQTERKLAEQERQQQTELLDNLLGSASLGFAQLEPVRSESGNGTAGHIVDFRYRRINDIALRQLNQPRADVVGRLATDVNPAHKSTGLFAQLVAVYETGEPYTAEVEYPQYAGWFQVDVTRLNGSVVISTQDITARKQADAQLREQAAMLEGILRSMQSGLVVFRVIRDADGQMVDLRYEYVSDRVLTDTGLTRAQIEQHILLELFTGAKQSAYWIAYQTVTATGQPQYIEEYYKYDGLDNYTTAQITALPGDRIVSSYQILNDLKRAQQQAEQQAELLQAVLDTSQVSIGRLSPVRDADGRVLDFCWDTTNQANAQYTGLSMETMLGGRLTQLLPGTVPSGFFDRCVRVLETGEPMHYEQPYFFDGLTVYHDIKLARQGDGVVFSSLDITTRKQAELQLQAQADLLQSVIDNTPAGIVLFESVRERGNVVDFVYRLTNSANAGVTGLPIEQMVGQRWLTLFPHFRNTPIAELFINVAETGQPRQLTFEAQHNGTRRWIEGSFVKQGDGVLFTFLDVTALKQAELEQQRQAGLLRAVVDNSPTGIVLYEAVRDPANGLVVDFRHALTNATNNAVTGRPADELLSLLLLEHYPVNRANGHYDTLVNVVETGQPAQRLLEFNDHGISGWFDAGYVKQGDGVLFTYVDVTALKQAELEQQRQRQLLQHVVDNVPAGIALFDTVRDQTGAIVDFTYRLANRYNAERSGVDYAATASGPVSALFPGWQQLPLFAHMRQVAETSQAKQYTDVYDFQGVSGWFDYSIRSLENGVMLTFTDVTALKQAELEQQRQRALLQNVVDNAPVGIVLAKAVRERGEGPGAGNVVDFRYTLTNQFNAKLAGQPVEAMNGQLVSALFPGWQAIPLFESMRTVTETGQPRQYSEAYDYFGIKGWFDYNVLPHDDGALVAYTDITAVKQAELAQQRQAEHLQYVLDSALAAIVECKAVRDEQGQLIDFVFRSYNRAAEQITGLRANDLIGKRVLELFPTARANGSFERWTNVVETGEPVRFTEHYQGEGLDVYHDSQLVKFDDGFIQSYVDISPLKRQQQELEIANRELQRSNENLQSFAYVASHDLQEPLRKIESFGNLLSQQYGAVLGQHGHDYIQRMQVAAGRMSLLIKDLLTYSRLSTQREPLRPVALADIVRDVVDDLEMAIQEAGATVSVDALPTLPADAQQLRQLFQNLLGNALKFRRPGVAPVVRVTSRSIRLATLPSVGQDVVEAPASRATSLYHQIDVVDNGIGFEEKYLDRIFQVFQRLHGRQQYAGSGVGLAICKKVVENHGGAISARSQPGAGTTFTVYLPAGK